jgi:hypothetical protein
LSNTYCIVNSIMAVAELIWLIEYSHLSIWLTGSLR